MNAKAIHEAEFVTRSIARWGSAAAAIIFGLAFIADPVLSREIVFGSAVPIGLTVAMFAGYTLAWTERFEVLGSVIALVSMIAAYFANMTALYLYGGPLSVHLPNPLFLAVGIPALIHLVAVVLHRHEKHKVRA
jgi:hypothetical protein